MPTLIFDHVLRGRRGVKRWRYQVSSMPLSWPSIQPKHSATSTASAYVTVGMPEPFLAILSQIPPDVACSASSHA